MKASENIEFKKRLEILAEFAQYLSITEDDIADIYQNHAIEWDDRVNDYNLKYKEIHILAAWSGRIDDFVPVFLYRRYFQKDYNDVLILYCPENGYSDAVIKELMGENFLEIDVNDRFWLYFILSYSGRLSTVINESDKNEIAERKGLIEQVGELFAVNENDISNILHNPIKEWIDKVNEYNKYKAIHLFAIWNDRIGEFIPRYLYARYLYLNMPDELNIYYPGNGEEKWCNRRLKRLTGRQIPIMDCHDGFWIYLLYSYAGKICCDQKNIIENRIDFDRSIFDPKWCKKQIVFSEDEISEAKSKAYEAGIGEDYICFSNRDSQYLKELYPQFDFSYHNYRDSSVDNFKLAAEYFGLKGIQFVRMGRNTEERATFDNCIDFSNDFYDELLDIYLATHCKIFISDESGINVLPRAYNVPCVTTNVPTVGVYAWSGIPLREDNLYIFKKHFSISENRFLTLEETLRIDEKCTYEHANYADMGISLIDNTQEEILDVAAEMDDYLAGQITYDDEDIELQNLFWNILNDWHQKMNHNKNGIIIGRVGRKFLKNNRYLFEKVDSKYMDLY